MELHPIANLLTLPDTDITSPSANNVLQYNGTKWENRVNLKLAAGANIGIASDTNLLTLTSNQLNIAGDLSTTGTIETGSSSVSGILSSAFNNSTASGNISASFNSATASNSLAFACGGGGTASGIASFVSGFEDEDIDEAIILASGDGAKAGGYAKDNNGFIFITAAGTGSEASGYVEGANDFDYTLSAQSKGSWTKGCLIGSSGNLTMTSFGFGAWCVGFADDDNHFALGNGCGAMGTNLGIDGLHTIGLGYNYTNSTANSLSVGYGQIDMLISSGVAQFNTDLFFSGAGTGLPYGHMYVDGTQSIIVALTLNTPTEVEDDGTTSIEDGWLAGDLNLMTFPTGGTEHYITITKAGVYHINWNLSYKMVTGAANTQIHGGLAVDGTPIRDKCEAHRTISNNVDVGNMAGSCIVDLPNGTEELSLWIENTTNSNDADVVHGSLVAIMVGGT